jgi:hypothetical protein
VWVHLGTVARSWKDCRTMSRLMVGRISGHWWVSQRLNPAAVGVLESLYLWGSILKYCRWHDLRKRQVEYEARRLK